MTDFWGLDPSLHPTLPPKKPSVLRWEYIQAIQEYSLEALVHLVEADQETRGADPLAKEGHFLDLAELHWRMQDETGPFR